MPPNSFRGMVAFCSCTESQNPRHKALIFTHIFCVCLVLNEMVLVLVIENSNRSITSTSTVLRTEHEHGNPVNLDF